jgi:hypothetical protein
MPDRLGLRYQAKERPMLEMKKGVDILAKTGGVTSIDEARKIFEGKLDADNLAKLNNIKNEEALLKIANAISLCKPDAVVVCTGSPEDMALMRQASLDKGEEATTSPRSRAASWTAPSTSSTRESRPASWPRRCCARMRSITSPSTWTAS